MAGAASACTPLCRHPNFGVESILNEDKKRCGGIFWEIKRKMEMSENWVSLSKRTRFHKKRQKLYIIIEYHF